MRSPERHRLALEVRRRAFGNLLAALVAQAGRSGGRLGVRALGTDGLLLHVRDVRTLVRGPRGVPTVAARDFTVLIACPARWPFERAAAVEPQVLAPRDWVHPNADGIGICCDLAGVPPGRLAALVYDHLRLRRFNLGDPVDARAAGWVRAHPERVPTDPRPLVPPAPEDQP